MNFTCGTATARACKKNRRLAAHWYEKIKERLAEVADEIYETGYHFALNAARYGRRETYVDIGAFYYFSKSGEWFYVGEIYRKAGDFDTADKWYAKYFEM